MATPCLDDETILAFVEATVETAEFVAVNGHLNDCDGCRQLVAQVARSVYQDGTDVPTSPSSGRMPSIPAIGTEVDRYVVTGLLGKGGMALVFAAFDPQLQRTIALKLVRPDNDDAAGEQRLLREAQAMARLTHPNVIRVYDAGTDEGRVFIAMEYVEGTTLARWLREQPRPWQEILLAFHAAGCGLSAAHAAGIVHRDFKPANVLLSTKGDVLVTDFGLARRAELPPATPSGSPESTKSLTLTGLIIGTPAYMAPEQFGGPADARSDQFAFCVALYEALSGVHPFSDGLGSDAPALIGTFDPRPPADWGVPHRIFAALCRGMAADPAARFPTMDELLIELGTPLPQPAASRWGGRGLALAVATTSLAVAIALIAWVATRSVVSDSPAAPVAAPPAAKVAVPVEAAQPAPRPVAAPEPAPPDAAQAPAAVASDSAQAPAAVATDSAQAPAAATTGRQADEQRRDVSRRSVRRPRKEEHAPAAGERRHSTATHRTEEPEGIFRNVYDED